MALINTLQGIGDAIREKTGGTELIPLKEMANVILSIEGGSGGVEYSSIVYNEDNTVTLTEKDGTIHTMACTYENGKLIGITYDGKKVNLTYADDLLLSVGGASVDVSKAPASGSIKTLDHTVTFKVDGAPYEIVSVKDGNSVNSPLTIPTSSSGIFSDWIRNDAIVTFPFTPTEDIELSANFIQSVLPQLYEHFNVSRIYFPYVVIELSPSSSNGVRIFFSKRVETDSNGVACSGGILRQTSYKATNITNYDNIVQVVREVMRVYSASDLSGGSSQTFIGSSPERYVYCNEQVSPPATFYLLS